jgi:hypothetical protein
MVEEYEWPEFRLPERDRWRTPAKFQVEWRLWPLVRCIGQVNSDMGKVCLSLLGRLSYFRDLQGYFHIWGLISYDAAFGFRDTPPKYYGHRPRATSATVS